MAVWEIIQIIEMKLLLIMMLVWPHPQDIKTMTTLTRRLRQPQVLPPRLMMLWWSALVTEARSGFDQPYITTATRLKQFRKYSYFIFYITSLSFQYGYHSLTYWQWDISGFHYLCFNWRNIYIPYPQRILLQLTTTEGRLSTLAIFTLINILSQKSDFRFNNNFLMN